MEFEWDDDKAATNITNHNVTFAEAATVFDDALADDFYDEDHSDDEARSIRIGEATQTGRSHTNGANLVRVVHRARRQNTNH